MFAVRALTAALVAGLWIRPTAAHSTERNPLRYVGTIEDPVLHAPSHRVHALSTFELSFVLRDRDQRIRLSLSPNHDIIAEDAVVQILAPDGSIRAIEPIDRLQHRVYMGDAFMQHVGQSEWTNVGWARISVRRDGDAPIFEGAFRVDGDHHHVQTNTNYEATRLVDDPEIPESEDDFMIVWRDSDIMDTTNIYGFEDYTELRRDLDGRSTCTSDTLSFNSDDNHPVYRSLDVMEEGVSRWSLDPRAIFGRQIDGTTGGNGAGVNLTSTIGDSSGCPSSRRVALVGIATDCTYTAQFNSTASVRENIIQLVNSASQVYETTFNISLGIQNLTINDAECPASAPESAPWNKPCGGNTTITDRLNLFSAWRGQFNDTNAYWTLMSTCNTDAAVGLAWLGQACVPGSQTSSTSSGNETIAAANVVVRTSTEWQVFAHETGHTFGAVHDCIPETCSDGTVTKQQCCPLSAGTCDAGGQFIMNPSTGSGITKFSQCSVGNICSAIGRNSVKTTCLTNNRDVTTITGSQCGNGIVEAGEDCDCGGTSGCGNDPCCDPTTCKFTTNSVCDPANDDCCTATCQFAINGTVCRVSTGVCDPAETCTGSSPVCPADVTAPDGTTCGASGAGLACASGQCTSRDLQCKTLMGSLTTGNDTYACSSSGCQLSCASPEFGANTCYTMQQNFLDGTPCEGGGKCSNGNCDGASVANEISSWISDNKDIVIPVAAVVGGLVVLAILTCCVNSWRRRRRAKRAPKPRQPPPGWGGGYDPAYAGFWGSSNPNIPPVPPPRSAKKGRRPTPPPPYDPRQPQVPWAPGRTTLARYA